MLLYAFVYVLLLFEQAVSQELVTIGVITVETDEELSRFGQHHIPLSYVNWIMQGGARVVPIKFDWPKEKILYFLERVNGVFFPGGVAGPVEVEGSQFFDTLTYVFNYAKEQNDKGVHYPIWGVCLGFEAMMMISVNDPYLLREFSANTITLGVENTEYTRRSRLLAGLSDEDLEYMQNEKFGYHWHDLGVGVKDWEERRDLNSFWNVIHTNHGLKGGHFISTIEAVNYPFYATQWHIEKSTYAFEKEPRYCHTFKCIEITHHMSAFFVNESRKNNHRFEDWDFLLDNYIENYPLVYTKKYKKGSSFCAVYFLDGKLNEIDKPWWTAAEGRIVWKKDADGFGNFAAFFFVLSIFGAVIYYAVATGYYNSFMETLLKIGGIGKNKGHKKQENLL